MTGIGTNSGHTRIYAWDGSSWSQLGGDIDGEAAGDDSGYSVSLSSDGTVVAIGARNINDGNGSLSRHVVFTRGTGAVGSQLGGDIDGEAAGDCSGRSVSLSSDGTVVAIGARISMTGMGESFWPHAYLLHQLRVGTESSCVTHPRPPTWPSIVRGTPSGRRWF